MKKMTKPFMALLSIGVCAPALSAPFNALSVEGGGGLPGTFGQGFIVTSGGFFDRNQGLGAMINTFHAPLNFFEFDTHPALDSKGPTARAGSATAVFYGDYGALGYNEGSTLLGASSIYGPGTHVGDWLASGLPSTPELAMRGGWAISPPPVPSGFAPNATGGRSTSDGVFVARLTVQSGSQFTGGIDFAIQTSPGMSARGNLVLNGASPTIGGQRYGLRAFLVAQPNITIPTRTTAAGVIGGVNFGVAEVWDIWVVQNPAPLPLFLIAPENAAGNVSPTATFDWSDSDATSYRILIDEDNSFGSPVVDQMIAAPSSQFTPASGVLAGLTMYFWRVEATNPGGTVVSGTQSFTTAAAPPACEGDANGSGAVNFTDLTTILNNWGANYMPGSGPGDSNLDGLVNFADFSSTLNNWGVVCPP